MIEPTLKTNKLIAVYGRVSTSNQENEGTIETQLLAVNEHALKNGYTIVQQYTDEGWSGDSIIRPALDQLRVDAKKKIWEAVLIYDPDRLARRYSYQELVVDELKEAGVEVLFVTIKPPTNPEDKILYGVRGLFTEYERVKIAERFRLGKLRKAKGGHIMVTEGPYGYNFIKKVGKPRDADFQHGYLEINEEEAKTLRNIFSWVIEGLTIRGIVRKLLELNIPPRRSKRGVWATSTIGSILKNQTYVGRGYFGATYATVPLKPLKKEGYKKVKKTSKRMRPKEEWILIPTPKIIDEELFNRVQQRLKLNFEASSRNTKNEYLLAGRIFCSCGNRRAGEGSQYGRHRYYRCTNRVHSFPLPPTCLAQGLDAGLSDQLVWDRLSKMMSSPDLLMKQAEKWLNDWNRQPETSVGRVEETRRDIAKLKTQDDRYNQAFSEGLFDLEKLKEYIAPIREKVSLLESQIIKTQMVANNSKKIPIPEKGEIDDFCHQMELKLKDLKFEAKKAIVKDIVDKVVSVEGQLVVSGYIPINYFTHVEFCPSYRYCRAPKCGQIHVV